MSKLVKAISALLTNNTASEKKTLVFYIEFELKLKAPSFVCVVMTISHQDVQ